MLQLIVIVCIMADLSFLQFFYILKGKLLFKINAQEYRLKPQMEIQIPASNAYYNIYTVVSHGPFPLPVFQ